MKCFCLSLAEPLTTFPKHYIACVLVSFGASFIFSPSLSLRVSLSNTNADEHVEKGEVIFFNNLLLKKTATILYVKLKTPTCSYWKEKQKCCIFHMCKQFITTRICIYPFTATPSGLSNDYSCNGHMWNRLAWMDLSDTSRCSFRRQLFLSHVKPEVDFDFLNKPKDAASRGTEGTDDGMLVFAVFCSNCLVITIISTYQVAEVKL